MPAVIDWMEGWEKIESEWIGRPTTKEEDKKKERQRGRQEGNVTRQGGDTEHRITVWWRGGGSAVNERRCVHMKVFACLYVSVRGWGMSLKL